MLQLKTVYKAESQIPNLWSGHPAPCFPGPKGTFLAALGNSVQVVELDTTNIVKKFEFDESESVTAFALNSAKTVLVVATTSLQITQWDFETKSQQRMWKGHEGPITALCFDPSDTLVASASTDHTIKVWDTEKAYFTHNFKGHEGVVTSVKFHPDPNRFQLFSTGDDCTVRVWDLVTKKSSVLSGHMSPATSISFSSSGWELVTSGRDKVALVWDLHLNKQKKTVTVFDPLEGGVVISSEKSSILKEKCKSILKKQKTDIVITGGSKGILKAYDIESGECIYEEKVPPFNYQIMKIMYAVEDDKLIVLTGDQNILYYDINTLSHEKTIVGFHDEIIDIKYSNVGNEIVVAANSEHIRVFDTVTKNCQILSGHTDIVMCLDVSILKPLLASGSKDRNIKVWDLENKSCIYTCVGHTEAVGSISFFKKSANNLVSGSRDLTIKLWEISMGKVEAKFTQKAHDKDVNCVCVAPNDKVVASGSQDKLIKLWSTKDLSLVGVLKGHRRGIWSIEFSPVEQCLASSSGDKTIKIWSITDFTCLKTFEGHSNSVLRISFLSKGTQLLSTSSDGLIKLWDIKENECTNTFDAHTDKIWALAIRKDEGEFISGGADSIINIWKDYSEIEEENQIKFRQDQVIKEQELSNALLKRDFRRAVQLAFALEQPFKLLGILESMFEAGEDVKDVIVSFSKEQLATALKYIRDWNTNARHSLAAQRVLKVILCNFSPSYLEDITNAKELIEGLMPYTERHYQRFERLLQQSFIIDYTLNRLNNLMATNVSTSPIETDEIADQMDEVPLEHPMKRPLENGTKKSTKKIKVQ